VERAYYLKGLVVSMLVVGGVILKLLDNVVDIVNKVEVVIVSMRIKDVSTTTSNSIC